MGRIQYYLVNHTLQEFCTFDSRVIIYEELKRVLEAWPRWQNTHTIMVKGEDESNAPDLWEHMTINLNYKDLDYGEHAGP